MTHLYVRWSAWTVFTVIWTVGLVLDFRAPRFGDTEEMRDLTSFVLAKVTHVAIYAGWAILTGWLKAPLKIRIFLLMFLMAHTVGTEWRQTYLVLRTGSLRDAALDQIGIFIGVMASFRWWTAPDEK